MSHIGIDLEQFVTDPYGSGIQRVLQQLALRWPTDMASADFVVPVDGEFALLSPAQAATVLSLPFARRDGQSDLAIDIGAQVREFQAPRVKAGDLLAIFDAWLIPEVTYLRSVHERARQVARAMPIAMIGYDVLPMSDPANYRFRPGSAAQVSDYFRLLVDADSVICISRVARDDILSRLRRDRIRSISVAHPGGDHLPARTDRPRDNTRPTVSFLRLGTLEARKHPREIVAAFCAAVDRRDINASLTLVGGPSASDHSINASVTAAIDQGYPITWIRDASDTQVHELVSGADVSLAIGREGFGIPVLESIRLGTPVLYAGVQPAAEIMVGRGAEPIDGLEHGDLVEALVRFSDVDTVAELQQSTDPLAVPTWSAFAAAVVMGALEA